MGKRKGEAAAKAWVCGSPLYDSYELVSLTHLIERRFTPLPCLGVGGSSGEFTSYSRPTDFAAGEGPTVTVVVDLPCSSSSSTSIAAGSSFGGVFSKKWWRRTKRNQNSNSNSNNNKNVRQSVSDHVLSGLIRSGLLKI